MKKRMLSLLLAGIMIFGMTACGKSGDEEKESHSEKDGEITYKVSTYYGGDSTEMAEFAADKLKEKYPNVTLEIETQPSDGGQTMKTRAAAGDLPDILLVDSGLISTLAESGSILPLDEYVDKFKIGDYYNDEIMENCLYSPDGHMYQFPMQNISPVLWYYNKAIFKENGLEPPKNFDELMNVIETLRGNDIIPMAMFGKEPWPMAAYFDSFALKADPEGCYALSEGKAKASDADFKAAIEKFEKTVQAGVFQDGVTNTDFDTAASMFEGKQTAMILNGYWYTAQAYEALGDDLGILTYYPTSDAGKEEENKYAMVGSLDTCGMAVSENAENPELAAEIAFWFAYYREVANYQATGLVTTPLRAEDLTLDKELDPISEELAEVLPNYSYKTKFVHTLPNTEFSTAFTEELQKFVVGESAEEFIANVDESIEKTVE